MYGKLQGKIMSVVLLGSVPPCRTMREPEWTIGIMVDMIDQLRRIGVFHISDQILRVLWKETNNSGGLKLKVV